MTRYLARLPTPEEEEILYEMYTGVPGKYYPNSIHEMAKAAGVDKDRLRPMLKRFAKRARTEGKQDWRPLGFRARRGLPPLKAKRTRRERESLSTYGHRGYHRRYAIDIGPIESGHRTKKDADD